MSLLKRRPRQLEKRKQFIELAKTGIPYRVINAALGICHKTSEDWRKEYKDLIPVRKRGRKPKAQAATAAVTHG